MGQYLLEFTSTYLPKLKDITFLLQRTKKEEEIFPSAEFF